jgi:hypothetical protein
MLLPLLGSVAAGHQTIRFLFSLILIFSLFFLLLFFVQHKVSSSNWLFNEITKILRIRKMSEDIFAFGLSAKLKPMALELLFLSFFAFGRLQSSLPKALESLFDPHPTLHPTRLY